MPAQPLGTGGGDAQGRVRLALLFSFHHGDSATPSSDPARLSCRTSCCRRPSGSTRRMFSSTRIGAARALGQLRQSERSFRTLRAFLGQKDREGIGERFERRCHGTPFGSVLDGDQNAISLDARFIGFDMTDLLDHPPFARRS
ncbi:hypothetical protein [Bradyrhizobium australiense]|uniref:hypothetical protein n=1 Tax=Bradyrhizobium australiense TaxID=2721161 RepID=UPI001F1ED158|nr:hypothetical protein [Bradyrhizobium australiense]